MDNQNKVKVHSNICKMLNDVYERKNHDYGDSFAKLRNELPNAILVRIYDKYSRLKILMQGADQKVKDESIDDTLLDLANYCIMELVERSIESEGDQRGIDYDNLTNLWENISLMNSEIT